MRITLLVILTFITTLSYGSDNVINISATSTRGTWSRVGLGVAVTGYGTGVSVNRQNYCSGLWDSSTKSMPSGAKALLKDLKIGSIRTSNTHTGAGDTVTWKDAVGDVSSRPLQLCGVPENLQIASDVGAEPVFMMTYVASGAQQAADLVEYLNSPNDGSNPNGGIDWAALRASDGHPEPYRVKYFEIGNEVFNAGTVDVPTYASEFISQANAMKAVDPTIKAGATLYLNAQNYSLVALLGKNLDFGIYHYYPTPVWSGLEYLPLSTIYTSSMDRTTYAWRWFRRWKYLTEQFSGKPIPLAVTEYNIGNAASYIYRNISTIVGNGTKATVTTTIPHDLNTTGGYKAVTITGTTNFNGTYNVTITGTSTFTFSSSKVASESTGMISQWCYYRMSLGEALVTAMIVKDMIEPENNIIAANYWDAVNEFWGLSQNGSDTTTASLYNTYYHQPAYYVLQQYGNHFGPTLLNVDVSGNTYLPYTDDVDGVDDISPDGKPTEVNLLSDSSWSTSAFTGATVTHPSANSFDITFSGCTAYNYYHISQSVSATAGKWYKISGDLKLTGFDSQGGISLTLYDGRNYTWGTVSALALQGTTDWVPISANFRVPAGGTGISVLIRNVGWTPAISTVVGSGSTATVTTTTASYITNGSTVTISGTSHFNGSYTATVTGTTTFTIPTSTVASDSGGSVTSNSLLSGTAQFRNIKLEEVSSAPMEGLVWAIYGNGATATAYYNSSGLSSGSTMTISGTSSFDGTYTVSSTPQTSSLSFPSAVVGTQGKLVNGTIPISIISGSGSAATISTMIPHGLSVGNSVTISGTTNYDGTYTVASKTTYTFTVSSTKTNPEVGAVVGAISSPQLQRGSIKIPYLNVNAAINQSTGKMNIIVVNQDLVNSQTATINISNVASVSQNATTYTLNSTNINDANFPITYNPNLVQLVTGSISNAGKSFTYTFPAHSFTNIELDYTPITSVIFGSLKQNEIPRA